MIEKSLLDSYRIIFNTISLKAKNTHAVFCLETGRVVAFTNWMQTAKQMEDEPNLKVWYYINRTKLVPSRINLNLPFEYVFDPISAVFVLKPPSDVEVEKYILYSEKAAVYDIINRTITDERDHIRPNISLQSVIYDKKYDEATLVLDSICRGLDLPDSVPYIKAQSEITGESVRDIAYSIVDKHKLAESRLLVTETIRLKYINEVRSCKDLAKLNMLLDEFNRETNVYGRV